MKKIHGWWLTFCRVRRFEYWPYLVFYFPMFFYGFYLALKSRSAMYFSTANPCMKYGGVMGESKMSILQQIDNSYIPATIMVSYACGGQAVLAQMRAAGLKCPVIAKPDKGERGRCVELIKTPQYLLDYHHRMRENYLVQEFIDMPVELGILYYRFPGEARGNISSVTRKEFLTIRGDGRSTVGALVHRKIRARPRLRYFKHKFSSRWEEVLPHGYALLLEPIGNHSRGTIFYDGRDLISTRLVDMVDNIAGRIDGFYYGRFDIRVASEAQLCSGGHFKILELNGVSSEPAHIYDPSNTLFRAYRDVVKHMRLIYIIGRKNHQRGHRRDSLGEFLVDLYRHFSRRRRRM